MATGDNLSARDRSQLRDTAYDLVTVAGAALRTDENDGGERLSRLRCALINVVSLHFDIEEGRQENAFIAAGAASAVLASLAGSLLHILPEEARGQFQQLALAEFEAEAAGRGVGPSVTAETPQVLQ